MGLVQLLTSTFITAWKWLFSLQFQHNLHVYLLNLIKQKKFTMILRKNTLPQAINPALYSKVKKQQLREKASSYINTCQSMNDQLLSLKKLKSSKFKKHLKQLNSDSSKSFSKLQIERIVNKNAFTVDFLQKNDSGSLPNITTIEKAKKLLVKRSIFEEYKENNKKNGQYQSGLLELEREADRARYRLQINKEMRLSINNHRLDKEKKSLSAISDERQDMKQKRIKKQIHRLSNNVNGFFGHSSHLSQVKSKGRMNRRSVAWNLKDFLDPLAEQADANKEEVSALQNRLKVLQKLQNITQECCDIAGNEEASKSIDLFARFSTKMDERLVKKQQKLDKVYHLLF